MVVNVDCVFYLTLLNLVDLRDELPMRIQTFLNGLSTELSLPC